MKKWLVLCCGLMSALFYQNCSGLHETRSSVASSEAANEAVSLAAFEKTLFPLLTAETNCIQCHGVSQQPLHSLPDAESSFDIITSFALVDLRNPLESALYKKVEGGNHNGMSAALATQIGAAIQDWADEIIANGGTLGGSTELAATFQSISQNILTPKCVSCHKADGIRPQERYTDYDATINTGKIVPGNAASSQMWIECNAGTMPMGGTKLTPQELTVLADWINDGALNN